MPRPTDVSQAYFYREMLREALTVGAGEYTPNAWQSQYGEDPNIWVPLNDPYGMYEDKTATMERIMSLKIDVGITRAPNNKVSEAFFSFPYGFKGLILKDVDARRKLITLFENAGYVTRIDNEGITLEPYRSITQSQTSEQITSDIELVFSIMKEENRLIPSKDKVTPFSREEGTYTFFNRKTHRNEIRLRDEHLEKMNLPTFKDNKKVLDTIMIPYNDRRQLKSLDVKPLFNIENRHICSMTGQVTKVRACNLYGSVVTMNPTIARNSGIELVWVKDLETYIYRYDPRFSLGRARVAGNSNRDENDDGDEERLLWYQTSYLESLGYKYCNGSEDWCNKGQPIKHRPSEFLYSENYRAIHCRPIFDYSIKDEGEVLFWMDHQSPLYYKGEFNNGDVDYSHTAGDSAGVPFNCSPEKFYGYYSEDDKGNLLVTRHAIPKTRYYGTEIELECKSDTDAKIMLEEVIPALLKIGFVSGTDGSLDNGVEFRSCPQVYNVLKENLKKFFEVVSPHFKVRSTCGVHIHVSREGLTELDIGKMLSIVYNHNNADKIEEIAGRESGEYQEYESGMPLYLATDMGRPLYKDGVAIGRDAPKPPKLKIAKGNIYFKNLGSVCVGPEKRRITKKSFHKNNKYTAINTNHTHTIEFRLFAGTKDYTVMMKYLGFVDALINFSKQTSLTTFSFKEFAEWVATKAARTYPELAKHMFPKRNGMGGVIPNFKFDKYMERRNKKKGVAA